MSSGRWPLLVDPQLQAIHWLKGMYQDKVDVVRLSSVDLLRKMSTAIKEGRTIIIENMLEDGPDAALMPVIARQIKVRVDCTVGCTGGTRCVTSRSHFQYRQCYEKTMKRQAQLTVQVECIRTCLCFMCI